MKRDEGRNGMRGWSIFPVTSYGQTSRNGLSLLEKPRGCWRSDRPTVKMLYRIVDAGVGAVGRAGRWIAGDWAAERCDGTVGCVRIPCGALNSAVECHLHTVEVAGSNPAAPTTQTQSIATDSTDPRRRRFPWLGRPTAHSNEKGGRPPRVKCPTVKLRIRTATPPV